VTGTWLCSHPFVEGLIADNLAAAGEFSIDLYTMPDMLTTKLWEHLTKKGLVA
jgi:membrane protease subunit (stomatin/prohibitin family)